jgi:hypothetical protein
MLQTKLSVLSSSSAKCGISLQEREEKKTTGGLWEPVKIRSCYGQFDPWHKFTEEPGRPVEKQGC